MGNGAGWDHGMLACRIVPAPLLCVFIDATVGPQPPPVAWCDQIEMVAPVEGKVVPEYRGKP